MCPSLSSYTILLVCFPHLPPPQGGATRFNYLDLAVRPTKGTAVLFFPAFADGVSDVRWVRECPLPMAHGAATGVA